MNEDFNNDNQPVNPNEGSQYSDGNIDNNMSPSNYPAGDNSSYVESSNMESASSSESNYASDNINMGSADSTMGNGYNGMNNQYTSYSGPQFYEQPKKEKKKHKYRGAAKLTAAAVAFGLVAGTVFQGIGYFAQSNEKVIIEQTADSATNNNGTTASTSTNTGKDVVPVNTNGNTVVTDVSSIVSNVMPSIVAINSTANVTNYDFFGRAIDQQSQASGSGIIIGQNGSNLLIATNNHVIDGAQSVEIVFSDNTKAPATVKGADANSDLAVLVVKMSDLSDKTAATIKVASLGNSDDVKAGEMAIAIGNALGYGQSVTVGYISAVNREVDINGQKMTLLQTDAAINPGNSGGALLNAAGQVIGINSVKYADTDVEGMGYAIPISKALPMINELMNRESVTTADQGFLGIDASTAQNVTQEYATRFNMPIGVYVNDVIKGSPAETAGLVQGDIITGLDNSKIETIDNLVSALSYAKAGQQVKLIIQVKENGAYVEKTLDVTLGKKPTK